VGGRDWTYLTQEMANAGML